MKRKAQPYTSCKYFKSNGNVFGGCKHPEANMGCVYNSIDDCDISERKKPLKQNA